MALNEHAGKVSGKGISDGTVADARAHPKAHQRRIELPTTVFGPVEVHHLQRELEALEEFLAQASIREPGKQPSLPRTSRSLEALAGNNNLTLLQPADRRKLHEFLQSVAKQAPVVHMSLAADPSAAFTAKVVAWLRTNVHPYTLLQLGLQPTIAAGCVIRTANKVFDFSLRHRFSDQRSLLLDSLNAPAASVHTPPDSGTANGAANAPGTEASQAPLQSTEVVS